MSCYLTSFYPHSTLVLTPSSAGCPNYSYQVLQMGRKHHIRCAYECDQGYRQLLPSTTYHLKEKDDMKAKEVPYL